HAQSDELYDPESLIAVDAVCHGRGWERLDERGVSVVCKSQRHGKRISVFIISSVGGHLAEIRSLRGVYEQYEVTYILNCHTNIHDDMQGRTCFISHSERDWRFILNLYEAWHLLRHYRPHVLLSAGAGCIVPFAIVGRIFKIPTIYLESMTNVTTPSLTGR